MIVFQKKTAPKKGLFCAPERAVGVVQAVVQPSTAAARRALAIRTVGLRPIFHPCELKKVLAAVRAPPLQTNRHRYRCCPGHSVSGGSGASNGSGCLAHEWCSEGVAVHLRRYCLSCSRTPAREREESRSDIDVPSQPAWLGAWLNAGTTDEERHSGIKLVVVTLACGKTPPFVSASFSVFRACLGRWIAFP
jgi:hypothetical protein